MNKNHITCGGYLQTKSPNEIFDWILTNKTVSKRTRAIWKRFIFIYLKNDSYNLHEIFEIINRNDLGETLSDKMLFDLEIFFANREDLNHKERFKQLQNYGQMIF